MAILLKHISKKQVLLLIIDFFILVISIALSFLVLTGKIINILSYLTGASTFSAITFLFSFYIFDLYNFEYKFKSVRYLGRIIFAVTAGSALIMILFYALPSWKFSRSAFILQPLIIVIFVSAWRIIFEFIFMPARKPKKVIIIGAGWSGKKIYDAIIGNSAYKVIGFLDDNPKLSGMSIGKHSVIGTSNDLVPLARDKSIDVAVIAITHEQKPELLKNVLKVKMKGVNVCDMPSLYEDITGKVPVDCIKDSWFVYVPLSGVKTNLYTQRLERFFDIVISLAGLLFTFPISLVSAILIKIESSGPVFYIQDRVGKGGKVFKIVKFRTMRVGSESSGPIWASENDPRVTGFGRIIRKLRIDEVPQMWNVLVGDISFIGPRPERPEFVKELEKEIPYYSLRHSVKPGITGWAQINYKYGSSRDDAEEKLRYDFYYIKNKSLILDLYILLKTIRIVLFAIGAR